MAMECASVATKVLKCGQSYITFETGNWQDQGGDPYHSATLSAEKFASYANW